jgi:diguanylate cyclase (GGDEF)-like protein
MLLGEFDLSTIGLPTPLALAIVSVIGYLLGKRRQSGREETENQSRRELKRAQAVAKELEKIAELVRRHLATHHASVVRFKNRMVSLGGTQNESAWQELCQESESMLKPTLKLAAQLANAYDEIRQQSNHLMTFTEVRTDPLTGVSNRRALDETLGSMFAIMNRYELPFSIVIVDIDHFKKINDEQGHLYGDSILKLVAKVLDDNVRDTDVVTRYGGEEFVIVMPQTPLGGACIFSDRLRESIEQKLPLTVSGGVSAAVDGDNPQTLLARADAALYSAKAAGRNRVYYHTGLEIRSASDNETSPDSQSPAATERAEIEAVLPQEQASR